MPSKRGSKKSKSKNSNVKSQKRISGRKKNKKSVDDDDIRNSEDEYISQSDDEYVSQSDDDESDYDSQSGGEVIDPEHELDSDSNSLDIDPDHEQDPNEDDKYNPIDESEELEDPDDETDIEDVGEAEEAGEEAGEEDISEEDIGEEDIGEDGEIPEAGEDGYTGEAKPCHLKNLNKDFITLDEDDSNMYGKMEYKRIADADRETDAVMTYYEMVRIIGTRAQQFNFGAEPLVKGLDGQHPAKMAYIELIAKMTPFILRRHLPGKKYEEWRVDELDIVHKITDDFFVPENFDWQALMQQASELNKSQIRDAKSSSARVTNTKSNRRKSNSKSNSKSRSKSRSKTKNNRKN